jgi:DNA-binding MarR family transcriptional regulator
MSGQRTTSGKGRAGEGKTTAPAGPPLVINRFPAYLARRFHQVCAAMVTESLADEGITQLQLAVIACLDTVPGIDQRRLAEAVGIVPVNAGQIVDELEVRGLVERRTNGADRRARELRLTAKGLKLRRQLRPHNLATNRRILAPLKPHEQELLLDLLIRVIEGNAIYARPGAGRRKRGSRRSLQKSTASRT